MPILFVLALRNRTAQRVLGHPVLLYLGLCSYPLYLLHENLMIALVIKLGPHVPSVLWPLLPLPVVLGLSVVAYPIARYFEPPTERFLRTRLFVPRIRA
jgi:peptidoglycan/LPS O-acetylase OafA/YrhL